jgi:formyl-CoA transferase
LERLEAQDLLCAPVRNLREALTDPQTVHNEMVIEGNDGEQKMRMVGSPIRMTGAPAGMRRPPPRLGEHTEEVLAEAQRLAVVHSSR